ncbi:sensor histidine kinase [Loigolactobacillus backii]|uniref:histidine kinase n=1 Tax=Loigolactobacillus backii TaxID=375175 RepID=A0A192GZ33_9LACO|nr:HAMP domain-containing sensor histidine kinase [Loigolactobacillus backii]ANK60643.1 two-component sensor histidine kinase [Loigolactobacillus backii]ANK61789.1 two-component sensor histidine kinase [Loigolactobacillus backii]ANK65596.1 two-component sensor histidine kinase [Loigolactobacillus backii]ANK68068.1 two-component sensor histidine kinase [Loigolactobacillus backii]ANK69017.1 two-component sensor histidine kinase [Loigolactobacillus backii]
MKFKVKQNSASIMLRSFILMITVIILLSSMTTVFAVGHQLLETSQINSFNIIGSLKKAVIDGNDDWKNWRLNSTLDTSTSYVQVNNRRKDATIKNYYSPGTKKLLSVKPQKIPFIKRLYYRKDVGPLYYNTGHARGIDYELWTNLNSQLETLERVVLVAIIILILTLMISPLYIHAIADRLTNSLTKLTASAESISTKPSQQATQLPVPDRPTEVTNLANSFNRLLNRLYQQSEKEKLFVSNAAHELRTPIATIRSHAQLIQRRGEEHPEIIRKSVNYINDESHQMQALVDSLLTLSRADRLVLDFSEFDLSQALAKVVNKMTPLVQQKIITEIPPNIKITAHEASINQIVVNLLNNANKYSAKDSEIRLILKKSANTVLIQVIDQGIGISTVDKEHIFERFYRNAEIRGSIPGTGLGLAIVKQLADLNHIKLKISDNHPQGTIFSLTL